MRHPARLGIALALVLATAGCSSAAVDGPGKGAAPPAGPPPRRSPDQLRPPDHPLRTPEPGRRLDQTSTETLLELGLQDRMAGTANLKTKIPARYGAAYARVPVIAPKIATGEQLRAATPDFVVAGSSDLYTKDRAGTREELDALKVPTFVSAVDCPERNPAGRTPFELLFSDYENLGRAFGVEDRAGRLAADQRAAWPRPRRPARRRPARRTGPPWSTSTPSSTACRTWRAGRACPAR